MTERTREIDNINRANLNLASSLEEHTLRTLKEVDQAVLFLKFRYEKEKGEIKAVADKLEADATQWDQQSDAQMHQHHRWAQSTTVLQVSIAMAAIALLTKKTWLEYAMFAAGGVGLVVGALAALHI